MEKAPQHVIQKVERHFNDVASELQSIEQQLATFS